MRLYAPSGAWERLREAFGDHRDRLNGRYAVIAPTSRWLGKLWPIERYAEVAKRLLHDPAFGLESVVVVGSEHERGQCGALLEMSKGTAGTGVGEEGGGVIDAIGRTSIATLMALVERSSLVIGSDSACVHMAVGFDRPLVALYGPTDVAKVGPYQKEGAVVQCLRAGDRFDHKDEALGREMMGRIATEDVLRKVGEVINDAKRAKEEGVGRTPSGVDA